MGEQMADVGLAIQRAEDKTEQMKARAGAVEELEAAGTFDDITQLGPPQDEIDRELAQLGAGTQVDDELAKMKAELGSGGGDAPALEQGRLEGEETLEARATVRVEGLEEEIVIGGQIALSDDR